MRHGPPSRGQRIGAADGWVTDWNLANLLAREGDVDGALARLDRVVEIFERVKNRATVIFHVPDRAPPTVSSTSRIRRYAAGRLQRALIEGDDVARRCPRCQLG